MSFATYSFAGPWIVGIYRLPGSVARLHQRVVTVDLFAPGPLHAFSVATAFIGMSLVAVLTFSLLTDPSTTATSAALILALICIALATASFIVPLWGMHQRLEAERERLVTEIDRRVEVTLHRLTGIVDSGDEGATEVKDTFLSLTSARDLIDRLSTWPWQPATPRWLVSALHVPLVLWGVTRLLERSGL